jgi:hypothetical protein
MAERITLSTNPTTEHTPLDVAGCVALVKTRMPNGWYDEGELTIIFERLNYWCTYFEISPRTVAAQILHETGWFRFGGDVYWWQFNFAGLGSTGWVLGHSFTIIKPEEKPTANKIPPPNSPSKDYDYTYFTESQIDIPNSIDHGILAVVVHHIVYTRGPMENWPPSWTQYRWNDPRYSNVIQAGLAGSVKTIAEYGGKWAFPGVGYGDKIVTIANLLPTKEVVVARPKPFKLSFPLTVDHIPWTNPNRTRLTSLPSGRGWITIHETGNTNIGADARMHRTFLHNGGGEHNVSFNYMVDDDDAYECVPRGERTWQASDSAGGPGNSSVSIELCVNRDGNWEEAKNRLIELVVWLIATDENLSVDRIAQHNTWAPDKKNCPSKLRANNNREWNILIARIKELAAEKAKDAPPPPPPVDPNALFVNGFWIVNEIYHEWNSLGPKTLPVYGYPISHMDRFVINGIERDAQIFERGILAVYEEDTPDGVAIGHPFRVRMLTLQEQDALVADAIERGIIKPFE